MRTLVIETATAACSVALFEGDRLLAATDEIVGRGHAEGLVPMIGALPDRGRAQMILVDCGPGSFTGVRVGLAAAIGLGIGWGVTPGGYSSLALLAASAFARDPGCERLAVVLEGGHGEVLLQGFVTRPFGPLGAFRSLRPEAALIALAGLPAIGNGVRQLRALDPAVAAVETLPSAADAMHLPPAFRSLPARPIYGRAPDATLPGAPPA